MKIARFLSGKEPRWGILEAERFRLLASEPYARIRPARSTLSIKNIRLLPPATPSKIILVGLNYRDHAKELGMKVPQEPVLFLKPLSSLIGHNHPIVYPRQTRRLDYEAELAVVIGKKAKAIRAQNARNYILGYSCLNDITARDLQKKDNQWTRAKSFDTFCPFGPWLETDFNPSAAGIRLYLNETLKQNSSTAQFIFSVEELIAFISSVMTLLPGDIISTGTPPGVGPMLRGDTVKVRIDGIGSLCNTVI